MTLKQYIKKAGSQEGAAILIGVRYNTIQRWLHKGDKPRSIPILNRLKELGIELK